MTKSATQGNFVSEWFGYRTFPRVHESGAALHTQKKSQCPFLSSATRDTRECVKSAPSSGVCTINNASNGVRQDWLVCPYRALDTSLVEDVVHRLFAIPAGLQIMVAPAPALSQKTMQAEVAGHLGNGLPAVVFLQNKLGGEISMPRTDRSPELSFDMTLVELTAAGDGQVGIGRFGVLEIQTMDFHGSYRHAVKNLKDSLRLHGPSFARSLQENQRWLADRIEGPNIANVFKRTFYQMMLKFQIGVHPESVGTCLALPQAVWDSWQSHLGRPELVPREDGSYALQRPGTPATTVGAWIYVFDIDEASSVHPSPIVIRRRILTDASSIAHYALEDAPRRALATAGTKLVSSIHQRLSAWWPELLAVDGPSGRGRTPEVE